jgi:hypothetical protein
MKILNLTQHVATEDQIKSGVIDLPEDKQNSLKKLLNFGQLPSASEIIEHADAIAKMAKKTGCDKAMIGGALFLMSPLERSLRKVGVEPVYAFSVRESIERTTPDGTVLKENKFRHEGFVPAV